MNLTRVEASGPVEDIARTLVEEGAVIVEDLLSPDVLARFNAELDPLLAATSPEAGKFINDAVAWFFGDRTRHITGVAGKSPVFATEILPHPAYMAVCDSVLLSNCASYRLNLAHVLDRGPGSEPQMFHRDEDVWVHVPRPHPDIQLASVVALVDFTEENGATLVVPGSHLWERDRQPDPDEAAPAAMRAGSAVVYLGSTIHAGGQNRTVDQWRRGMHLSYCVGWLRTEENQFLSTSLDVVRGLPRRSQELLGYGAHDAIAIGGGYLGTVELQDPVELLAAGQL